MKSNRSWKQTFDAIFLFNWRKGFLVVLLLAATAVAMWAVFGMADLFFQGLSGEDVIGVVNRRLAGGQATGIAASGSGIVLATLVYLVGAVLIPLYLLVAPAYTIVRTQPRRRYLQLSWFTLLLIPAFFLGVVLHNVFYALFFPYFVHTGGDEPVLFLAVFIGIPLYLLVIIVNTIIHFISGRGAGVAGSH